MTRVRKWKLSMMGGSPGLVVMGRASRIEGRGFESRHHILMDIFTYICSKYCLIEKTENNRKRGRGWPFFKKLSMMEKEVYEFRLKSRNVKSQVGLWKKSQPSWSKVQIQFSLFESQKIFLGKVLEFKTKRTSNIYGWNFSVGSFEEHLKPP